MPKPEIHLLDNNSIIAITSSRVKYKFTGIRMDVKWRPYEFTGYNKTVYSRQYNSSADFENAINRIETLGFIDIDDYPSKSDDRLQKHIEAF